MLAAAPEELLRESRRVVEGRITIFDMRRSAIVLCCGVSAAVSSREASVVGGSARETMIE